MSTNNNNTSDAWRVLGILTSGKLDSIDIKEEYNKWSTNYKQDNDRAGYRGPAIGALKVAELAAEKDCRILDVGCGTGLVGEQLANHAFTNMDGVDISEKSIEMARGTGLYKNLTLCDIIKNGLPGDKDQYDMLVCVGTFIPGHLTHAVFPEFCRVVKPGGFMVVVMREEYLYTGEEFRGGQMDAAIVGLAENRTWNYVSRERVNGFIGEMHGAVFTFQKR